MTEEAIAIRQPLQVVRSEPAVRMGFDSAAGFDLLLRAAKGFSTSELVPKAYSGPNGIGSCMIALEMANRMGASPLMVMQNLYIVHGSPSWSSKFLVACFNQCGRFSALRYEFDRDEKGTPTGCRAWAVEKATGERLTGSTVTIDMAKREGWSTKSGSKWITMPEQMLMYRAAAFMIRSYAPEISMGLHTDDEVVDMGPTYEERPTSTTLADIKAKALEAPPEAPGEPPVDEQPIADAPTYAQLADRIYAAETMAVLEMIGEDVAVHEPKEQRDELLQKLNARGMQLGKGAKA